MKIVLATCLCLVSLCSGVEDTRETDHDKFNQDLLREGNQDLLREGKKRDLRSLSPEELVEAMENLVARIDGNEDGLLDRAELVLWLRRVEDNTHQKEADLEFAKEDRNKDGVITFKEYWHSNDDDEAPVDEEDLTEAQLSVQRKFKTADTNNDSVLDIGEFTPFIHPFRHDHMLIHLIDDQLTIYDYNEDGVISLEEYLRSYIPEGDESAPKEMPEWLAEEQKDFEEHLDLNSDGELSRDEIGEWMSSNEGKFQEEEAGHLFKHADKNKDGFLSVMEVRAELDIFVDSPVTDYGYTIHEEL